MLKFKQASVLFFVLILLYMSFAGCNSSDTKKTSEVNKKGEYSNPFFPAAEGNYWIYINKTPQESEPETFSVKVESFKSRLAEVTSFPYLTKESTPKNLTVNSKNEIEVTDYMGNSGVIIPSPDNFTKGYKWTFGIFGGHVNDVNVKVETDAGTFENCCYVTMTEGFTFSFELWYKKGVGIVKWGANRTNPPTLNFIYYDLKDYKVK
jgi:hypothetical protein